MLINGVEYRYWQNCKIYNVRNCFGKDLLEHANTVDLDVIFNKVSFEDFLNAEVQFCYHDGCWKIMCAACEGRFVGFDNDFIGWFCGNHV
jgi:hypothetical protein